MRLTKSILLICLAFTLCFCACARSIKIADPGFEEGLGSWEKSSWDDKPAVFETVSDPQRGMVAHIVLNDDGDARLIQKVKVKANTSYKISCYVKTSGVVGGAGANIGVHQIPVSGGCIKGDTDWTYIELTGTTVKGQTELPVTIGIGGHGSVSRGEAWFDDVKIETVQNAENLFGEETTAKTGSDDNEPTEFPTKQIMIASVTVSIIALAIAALHFILARKPFNVTKKNTEGWPFVVAILAAAFILRCVLSLKFYGHRTDINDFVSWGKHLAQVGPSLFYDTVSWCDYPPGYILIIGFFSRINSLFKITDPNAVALMIKMPGIIADLACAYIIYRLAKKTMRRSAALALMALVAFTPIFAYISGAWGQIDQVLALTLIVPIILLYDRRPVTAGLIYGFSIIMKPQALMCGPLFAAAYFLYIFNGSPYKKAQLRKGTAKLLKIKKDTPALRIYETVFAVLAAFGVLIFFSLIFKGNQPAFWLVKKYYGTATSYDYATVNAYNFWALKGKNWYSLDPSINGQAAVNIKTMGYAAMGASVLVSIGLYVFASLKHKNCKGALPMLMALMLSGIYTFGHFMHERYVFPAFMLIMLAYVYYNDWRLLVVYLIYTATILVNCIAAFYYSALWQYGLYWDINIIKYDSIANIVSFALLFLTSVDLAVRNKPLKAFNG